MTTLAEKLAEHGIRLRSYDLGSNKILCPQCSHKRRKKNDPCLSVTVNESGAAWNCHNCGWDDGVREGDAPAPRLSRLHCLDRLDDFPPRRGAAQVAGIE